jgi:hypothetical protein
MRSTVTAVARAVYRISTFRGDGAQEILDLAAVIRDALGRSEAEREG